MHQCKNLCLCLYVCSQAKNSRKIPALHFSGLIPLLSLGKVLVTFKDDAVKNKQIYPKKTQNIVF